MGIYSAYGKSGRLYNLGIAGDAPTPQELEKIPGILDELDAQYFPQQSAPLVEEDDGTALGRGLSRGVDILQEGYGSAVEGIGSIIGNRTIEDYGREVVEAQKRDLEDVQRAVATFEEVKDLGTFATYFGETLGETSPQLASTIAGSIAGQAMIPIPGVGAAIGGLAANIPFFYGMNREAQKDAIQEGYRTEMNEGAAALTAIPQAALDLVVDRLLVGLSPTPKLLQGGGIFTRVSKGVGAGAAIEAPTEVGQQLLERYQAGKPIDDEEAINEYREAAIAGGLVGGTVRGTTSAFGAADPEQKQKDAELNEDLEELAVEASSKAQFARESITAPELLPAPAQVEEQEIVNQQRQEDATTTEELLEAKQEEAQEQQQEQIDQLGLAADEKAALAMQNEKEAATEYEPVELDTLPEEEQFNIIGARDVRGDALISAPVTIEEIENLVGPEAAQRERNKQKPLSQGVDNSTPKQSRPFRQDQYEAAVEAVRKDGKVSIPRIARAARIESDDVVNNGMARELRSELIRKGVINEVGENKYEVAPERTVEEDPTVALEELDSAYQQELDLARDEYRALEQRRQDLIEQNTPEATAEIADVQRDMDSLEAAISSAEQSRQTVSQSVQDAKETQVPKESALPAKASNNASRAVNSEVTDNYGQVRQKVANRLRKYLRSLGLTDVNLVTANVLEAGRLEDGTLVEGFEEAGENGNRIIALAMEIYDPSLSDTELEARLRSVMNHEIIHSLKALGLFTDAEFASLVKAAENRKYVAIKGGKAVERSYTYLDRAKRLYPGADLELQQEEAVAELFRDWADGKIKLAGRPNTLFQRIKKFIKSIFNAHNEEGIDGADQIFSNIVTSTKEDQIGSRARQQGLERQQRLYSLRRTKTGQYVGAPQGIDSPQKLRSLRRKLEALAAAGEEGRFWYERSGQAILEAAGGNKREAEKIVQAIAITSPSTPVKDNFAYAIQAYAAWRAGKEIKTGRFPQAMSKRLEELFNGKDWEGRKTNNFYINLMREIDPERSQGVTIDIWMMRALGYDSENPTDAQYSFAEEETLRIANKYGWEPQQAQAAIWVAAKAAMDGKPVSQMSYDYSTALEENLGQISWESIPGATANHMPEMFDAPMEQQAEYHVDISKAFLDDEGFDIAARELGLLTPGDFEAPGYFEGKVSPGTQTEAVMARQYKGPTYGQVDAATEDLITAYAAVRGILMKQDGVGWHRPWFGDNVRRKDSNGVEIRLGRPLTQDETARLAQIMSDITGHSEYNPIGSRDGARIINFDYVGTENADFQSQVEQALEAMEFDGDPEVDAVRFAAQTGYAGNDWSVNKNGEGYIQAGLDGRPSLQRRVQDIVETIQSRIDDIDADYSEKYGWTRNNEVNANFRATEEAPVEPQPAEESDRELSDIDEGLTRDQIDDLQDARSDIETAEQAQRKYSVNPTKPFALNRAPIKRDTYEYGQIREGNRLVPVVLPAGRHFDDQEGSSFGLHHIQERNHDTELQEVSKYPRVEEAIYDLLARWRSQQHTDGSDVVGFPQGRNFYRLEWVNNTGRSKVPLNLVLQRGQTKDGNAIYFVKTFFPDMNAAQPQQRQAGMRRRSALPMTSVRSYSVIMPERQSNIAYSRAGKLIQRVIGKPLKLFVGEDKAQKLSEQFITNFQDNMYPVAKLIDDLKAAGANITDALDTYLQEELYHGRVGARVEENQKKFYTPLAELVRDINIPAAVIERMSSFSGFVKGSYENNNSAKLTLAEAFLYARHAKERNAYIRGINPGEDSGSGMTDAEADKILAFISGLDSETQSQLAAIADAADATIQNTNDIRVASGLTPDFNDGSPVTLEDGTEAAPPSFSSYVPLRGILDPESEATEEARTSYSRGGDRFGVRGREDRRALGRGEYAESILANIMTQNQNAIIRSEKNNVGKSFLELIRQNPELMAPVARVLESRPTTRGLVNGTVRTVPAMMPQDDILVVKDGGQEVYIEILDPRIAKAMKGASGMSTESMGVVTRAMGKLNRYLSNINTSFNPEFLITNLVRDLQTAGVNLGQFDQDKLSREVLGGVTGALKGIKRSIINGDNSSEWSQIFEDFVANGGKTSANPMTTLQDQLNSINDTLGDISDAGVRKQWGRVKRSFVGDIFRALENYNTVVENGIRVATYKALLDRGYTKERAAQAAKNVTVNFTKGGEYKTFMNSWSLFYNASLQGSMALLTAATRSKRVQKLWAGVVVAGLLQDQLNAALSEEDEDGELQYDKIPDYVLEHNFILPDPFGITERSYIKIPLPYGLNMAHNIGRTLSRSGRGEYQPGEATSTIVATILEAVNPMGGLDPDATGYGFLNFVAPTIADPFIDIAENEDFANKPVYKEASQFGVPAPDSQLYWSTTSPSAKWITDNLNSLTGGTPSMSGYIDISPDILDFWFEFATGGVGRFVQRTAEFGASTAPKIITGDFEDEMVRAIPLARKVVGSVSDREDTENFINNRNVILTARRELLEATRAGDVARIEAVRNSYADELAIAPRMNALNNRRNQLLRRRNQIKKAPNIPEAQREKLLERVNEQIQEVVLRANQLTRQR
jgi:hypothetical protein